MDSGEGMRRLLILCLCLCLAACGSAEPVPSAPEVLEEAAYWSVAASGPDGPYRCTVTDGEAVLLEEELEVCPALSLIEGFSETVVQIHTDGGIWRERYVRLSDGAVTKWLDYPIAATADAAACLVLPEEERTPVVQVYDLWNDGPVRTFHIPFSEELAIKELVDYAALDFFELNLVYQNRYGGRDTMTLDLFAPDWEDNPIERFYRRYSLPGSTTLELNLEASAYMDAWKAEAEHAYALLAEQAVNPDCAEMARAAAEAADNYAEQQAQLKAWVLYSNAFDGDWDGNLAWGTGLSSFEAGHAAGMYEAQVREIYTQLFVVQDLDEVFVFDPGAYLHHLRDDYELTVEER